MARVTGAQVETSVQAVPRGSRLDRWWLGLPDAAHRGIRIGVPLVVMLIAAVTRLWNLGHPRTLVFDETFYVKDAWSLVNLGYEATWPDDADAGFATGATDTFTTDPAYVVHPPLGKLIIGLGMAAVGSENPVGWRIGVAVVGILGVAAVMLLTWLLTRAWSIASVAGLLMAVDGNAIVMSRVGLLDNMVMLFALLGMIAIALDGRTSARLLERWRQRERRSDFGPVFWRRPWLITAGVLFGLTASVKWSGLYFLAACAVYSVLSDAVLRRRAGIPFWFTGTLFKQGPASFVLTVPVALAAYLATWAGWFSTDGGYDRHWAEQPGNAWSGALAWVPRALQSLWHYQSTIYAFHVGESRPHDYAANPLTWLFMVRPTSMYYESVEGGTQGCAVDLCGQSITGIANPLIWWAGTAALGYLVYRVIRRRDRASGFVLLGMVAGYLPWLAYLDRTVYQFYTIAFEPYLVIALAFALARILGSRDDPAPTRRVGLVVVGVFLALVLAVSVYFWPLWTGMQLDYGFLSSHWWLPTWR